MTAKRKTCQSCGGPTSGVRCQPCKEAAWHARQRDPGRTCSQCGTRKPKSPQHPRCLVCMKGGLAAYNAWNKARKHAKGYQRPREAVEAERSAMRAKRAEERAAQPMRVRPPSWPSHPLVVALVNQGATQAAAIARVRYHHDPAYRVRAMAGTNRQARRVKIASRRDGTLTRRVVEAMYEWQHDCPYCGVALTHKTKSLDHIMPLARGGMHAADNVVVCCRTCNLRKRTKTAEEYVAWRHAHRHAPGA